MGLNIVNDLKYFVEKKEESKFYTNNKDTDTMRENMALACLLSKGCKATFVAIAFFSFCSPSPSDK